MRTFPARRLVCLTEETVETLYLLGEQDRIVGVSGYAIRPPEVRREKPRVSAFTSADVPKIVALKPDLVLADEPTGNLDTHTGDALFTLMRELNKARGTTFVIVTHNDKLSSQADRIIHIQDGQILQ